MSRLPVGVEKKAIKTISVDKEFLALAEAQYPRMGLSAVIDLALFKLLVFKKERKEAKESKNAAKIVQPRSARAALR